MKIIEITVDSKGQTKVETRGFTGGECREASKFIEQALGQQTGEKLTAEYLPGPGDRPATQAVQLIALAINHFPLSLHSPIPTRRPFMTLAERLSEYVRACFTGIWVQSFEHDDAIVEIARLCRQQQWSLATWDIDRGLSVVGPTRARTPRSAHLTRWPRSRQSARWPRQMGTALLVLRNFHRFLGSVEVVQALDTAIAAGKQNRTILVILSPVLQIPSELDRQFVVLEHDLPPREQIQQIARSIATEPGELPDDEGLGAVLDAAAGLTRVEAENAFSLSLIRHGRVTPDVLWELKGQTLKKSGLMTIHRGGETFADLGGLDALKAFCRRSLVGKPGSSLARPRGVLLLGVPGTGKSGVLQGPGQRGRTAHADPRHRGADGLAGRPDRGADPAGPADRRRDGPVPRVHRRDREGTLRRPGQRSDR